MLDIFIVLSALFVPFILLFMFWAASHDAHIRNLNDMLKGWPHDSAISREDKIKTKNRFPDKLKDYNI